MTLARSSLRFVIVVCGAALVACAKEPPQALGTLEFDRITLPAVIGACVLAPEGIGRAWLPGLRSTYFSPRRFTGRTRALAPAPIG